MNVNITCQTAAQGDK